MESVTYYARFGYCGEDGICVSFPDVPSAITGSDTKEHAVEMAKEVLLAIFIASKTCNVVVDPPRTLAELNNVFGDELDEYELNFEFVPITINIPDDVFLDWMIPNPRYK